MPQRKPQGHVSRSPKACDAPHNLDLAWLSIQRLGVGRAAAALVFLAAAAGAGVVAADLLADVAHRLGLALALLAGGDRGVLLGPHAGAGGGRDERETVEQTAFREILEETGMSDVRLGPVVWYGEDGTRSGGGRTVLKEHFIVAHAPTEVLDTEGWTEAERDEIIDTRWWTTDELRASVENIFPRNLGALLETILAGIYPSEIITLPPI